MNAKASITNTLGYFQIPSDTKISVNNSQGNIIFIILTHSVRKDLTKNASGEITDHYNLP